MSKKPNRVVQYKIANEKFLEQKAQEEGIKALESGILLPACFRVDELIVGWQEALLRMHEGDTLQIFLPAKYGYGSAKIDGIPAWSTLDFTLSLVKIL